VTIEGEVSAIRAVARQMKGREPEPRRLGAWASALETSARNLSRSAAFLRAEAAGRLPELGEPAADGGYDGLELRDAAARFASAAARLAVEGAPAAALLAERQAFLSACDLLSAPRSSGKGSPGPLPSPDASGAGLARPGARATSKKAALDVLPATGKQRRRILDAIVSVSRDPRTVGLTDPELQRMTGIGANSERPRRVELCDGGWLEDSGQTREHAGGEHTVWVLTEKARETPELWGGRLSP